jgi:hypothetical protein
LMPIMIFMTRYYHSFKLPRRSVSVSNHIFKIFRNTFFALAVIFVSSCEEGPTQIGEGILPSNDFVTISSMDTLKISSYTMYDDSVRSDNPQISFLGQLYDPYFGTTSAGFVSQIRLGGKWDDLPFIIDSVKLLMQLADVKRLNADVKHYLRLSEISEQLYVDSAYYSNRPVPLTGYEVTNIEIPALTTGILNEVSIKLPVEFGNYLTRDTAQFFYSNTKPDFRSYFKGLYFQIYSSSDPLFTALSLAPPTSAGTPYSNYFVLYMSNPDGSKKEFYFILDAINRNAAYNKFDHNFTTADPAKKINHINDGYKDTLSYLQYLNGVYTKITLPGLENIKKNPLYSKIAVNKARIIVPVYFDGNLYKPSTVPPNLRLRYKTKNGYKYDVPDYSIDTYNSFFDGTIDSTANVYKFNIPAFVQAYLKDATESVKPELEIYQGSGTRNVIFKANHSKTPVKFELTYTKF